MSDEDGWEDDDMADLFSFGTDGVEADAADPAPPAAASPEAPSPPPERKQSNDSILDMLDGDSTKETSVLGDESTSKASMPSKDADEQEILDWLDEEEGEKEDTVETKQTQQAKEKEAKEEEESPPVSEKTSETPPDDTVQPTEEAPPAPTFAVLPPASPKLVHFESLEDALYSSESNMVQVRSLFVQGGMKVETKHRPHLWCRAVCGKTLPDVLSSSLADSFFKWQQETTEDAQDERSVYIRKEAAILAPRIVAGSDVDSQEEATKALVDVLLFHYQSSTETSAPAPELDPLLPPVACTLLSAGISPAATSVMLSKIMPSFMPLLALSHAERWEAAKSLHTQFYLLACYHLPLLVFHLDRYAPGWYWPKKLHAKKENESVVQMGRNLESHGVVPQSWLISHLAGECGGTLMNPLWLLSLWDLILTSSNNSLRFFLSLAVLEKHSDSLLMLTGVNLVEELHRVVEFKEGTTPEGFAIVAEEETSESEAVDWVQEWCDRARSLWEATPRSVVTQLRMAEDEAFQKALVTRRQRAEEEFQARLQAQAKAHREAAEAEQERKAEEARTRLSRARLVAYYRTHNPEKEANIDKIMKVYEGRLDVLDMKLKAKYGVGFRPALKPKKANSNLFSTMNQGLNRLNAPPPPKKEEEPTPPKLGDTEHQVTVKVSVTEVLPIICWTKEAAASKGITALARGRYSDENKLPLKFYLVDSRPEVTVQEQGRFPTAVTMSPEILMNPERMEQNEEMFESLRGAVHICIMGEGFAAIPKLYGHKLTPKMQKYIDEDDSRTSLCALFFSKKGFPFVSILDGGFVEAHSWLCREGPKRHLDSPSVLVDYDKDNSFFARMEREFKRQQDLANASTKEKTQHALQNLLDSSMTSLTRNAQRIENLASESKVFRQESEEEEASFVGQSASGDAAEDAVVEEEGSFVNREQPEQPQFSSRLASIRSAAANLRKSEVGKRESQAASSEEGDKDSEVQPGSNAPVFRNPFAARKGVTSAEKDSIQDASNEESGTKAQAANNSIKLRNPFASRKGVAPADGAKAADRIPEDEDASDLVDVSIAPGDGAKPSGGGFASLKKNAFARFGGKGAEGDAAAKPTDAKPNRFGSINVNQLRLNALSSLRGNNDGRTYAEAETGEESISFDDGGDSPSKDSGERDAVIELM